MLLKEKNDIVAWLDKYNIENYTLRSDDTYGYVVDVDGSVFLRAKNLIEITIKFGHVSKGFYCNGNQLISLEGSPDKVGGIFKCDENQLMSLEGGPHTVENVFYCNDNHLTSLKGLPQSVKMGFYCDNNPELGQLQKMENLDEIKAYLLAEKLAMQLPHDLNHTKKVKL